MLPQTRSSSDPITPRAGSVWRTLLDWAVAELQSRWDRSVIKSIVPARLLKFAIVGSIGVAVNLLTFALVVGLLGWADWRPSVIGTLCAIGHNYVLNNIWTFRDRMKRGIELFHGYLSFLGVSGVGL